MLSEAVSRLLRENSYFHRSRQGLESGSEVLWTSPKITRSEVSRLHSRYRRKKYQARAPQLEPRCWSSRTPSSLSEEAAITRGMGRWRCSSCECLGRRPLEDQCLFITPHVVLAHDTQDFWIVDCLQVVGIKEREGHGDGLNLHSTCGRFRSEGISLKCQDWLFYHGLGIKDSLRSKLSFNMKK